MKNIQFDIRNRRNQYMLAIVVLILAGGYFFWDSVWAPFDSQKNDLELQITKFQKELDDINRQRNRNEQLDKQLLEANADFARLKEMFPEQEEVPKRLQDLYSVIRSSGVVITDFSPKAKEEKEYYIEHSYSIGLNAGYHMMGYLFAEIANFKYPVSITDLKISRYANIDSELQKAATHGWTPITMKVSFRLSTFTSKIDAAIVPTSAQNTKAKGKS
jgi:type IV pilus assembly protein PilO